MLWNSSKTFLSATIRGVVVTGQITRESWIFEGFFVLARRSILSSETARRSKQVSVRSKRQLFCAAAARGSPRDTSLAQAHLSIAHIPYQKMKIYKEKRFGG